MKVLHRRVEQNTGAKLIVFLKKTHFHPTFVSVY